MNTTPEFMERMEQLEKAVKSGTHYMIESLLNIKSFKSALLDLDRSFGQCKQVNLINLALLKNNKKTLKLLLEYGFNPNKCLSDKSKVLSPLWYAFVKRRAKLAKILVAFGADVNQEAGDLQDTYDCEASPLHAAVQITAYRDLVTHFLASGADVNAVDSKGIPVLQYAFDSREGNTGLVRLLLEHGARVGLLKKPILLEASSQGNLEVVQLLLAHGADALNARDEYRQAPMHRAAVAYRKNLEIAKLLMENGAEVDPVTDSGETPLHLAVTSERSREDITEMIEFLLDNGAEVDARARDGKTPLSCAIKRGDPSIVKLLLKRGADPNAVVDIGITVLHLACLTGNSDVVSLLLKFDANFSILLGDMINQRVRMILLKHAVKLVAEKRPVCERSLRELDYEKDLIFRACVYSMKQMRKTKVNGYGVTFYGVFSADDETMLDLVQDREFTRAFEAYDDLEKLFPLYGSDLKEKFAEAKRKFELLNPFMSCVNEILNAFDKSDEEDERM